MAKDADRSSPGAESQSKAEPTVVGIGASAGGLAALRALFAATSPDSGLIFVVVVHLSPEHESHLADLLQPHVKMPIRQVTKSVPLKPNCVYVIPPGRNLSAIDTHLRLSPLEERRQERAPIDHFFRTLAQTHDGHSVGVVLTGTGSDGTLGVKDIKAKGGLVVVQDPNEAEYDGMPQSALASGVVDFVLPLREIPDAILRFARTEPSVPTVPEDGDLGGEDRALLHKIYGQLRARTGRDFSRYKQSTIFRRISRRMQLNYIESMPDYVQRLRDHPEETRALADDLLITVTSFFRDEEVFEKLEKDIIPKLFEGKTAESELRVWSVGCATGEEAYSLAILLLEHAARVDLYPRIQIFASDLHEHSLRKAREGFYPGDIDTDVGGQRLKRFFQKENGGYRVRKEVREMVVFTPHNLLGDPPFSRLSMVSCRNLLIYLQREIQADIIELFHYALRTDGYLLLGTSETIENPDLFRTEDKTLRIFQKRSAPSFEPRLPVFPLSSARLSHRPHLEQFQDANVPQGALHQRLVELYAPPSLLVSPDDKVMHFSEHVGRFLVQPGGAPTLNVFKLVREELAVELRSCVLAARERRKNVSSKPVAVKFNGTPRPVVIQVRPALEPAFESFLLVMFDEQEPEAVTAGGQETEHETMPRDARIRELELDLAQSRERLQAIVEEYDSGREEMRASNEELQSMNEELRSTMEELETSKEELQSMNEELQTVNQENRHKVEELAQLSSDLQNLLAATDIATLFLDRELRILRFTPKVAELFNIRLTDRGRPLSDLTHKLGYADLHINAAEVFKRLTPIECEVRDDENRWYLTRILPYRGLDDRIEGVVITLVDISERKKAEDALRASEERLRRMINVEAVGVMTLTDEGRLIGCNDAFREMLGYSREEVESGKLFWRDLTPPEFIEVSELQMEKLAQTGRIGPYEKQYIRKDGSRSWMVFAGAGLGDGTIIKYCIDILDRKQAEQAVRESRQQLAEELRAMERLHELVGDLVGSPDLEKALELVLKSSMEITGAEKGNIQLLNKATGKLEILAQEGFDDAFLEYFREVDADEGSACARALRSRQRVVIEDVEKDPAFEPYRSAAAAAGFRSVQSTPFVSRSGDLLGVLSTHHRQPYKVEERHARILDLHARQAADFIERLRGGQALRESEERYRLLVESAHEYAILMLDLDGRIRSWNAGAQRIFGYSATEAIGQSGSILFTEEDRTKGVAEAEMETAARTGKASDDRWQVRKDGSAFFASGVMETLRSSDGSVVSFVKVLRDNTEKKQMEEAQARLNERLEELVSERTSALRAEQKQVRELAARLTIAEHEERHRIAQILHDDLQQLLYSVQLKLALMQDRIEAGDSETALSTAGEAEKWVGEAVRTAQQLSVELSPQVLQNDGLAEALRWLTAQIEELHGLEIDLDIQEEVRLPQATRVIVFQAIRELLFNVVKHAGVKHAKVELGRDGGLFARVIDQGKGFDVKKLDTEAGFGMMSVRHRLGLLGGGMEIESSPGGGAVVTIRAPLGSNP